MLLSIFVLHDITAEVYTSPFFTSGQSVAKRTLKNMVETPGSTIYTNPEDFRLYEIGIYDDSTGTIDLYEEKLYVCRASDFAQPHNPPLEHAFAFHSAPGVDSDSSTV